MTPTSELFAIAEAAIEYEVARKTADRIKDDRNAIADCDQQTAWLAGYEEATERGENPTFQQGDPCWKRYHYVGDEGDREREPESKWCASCLRRQRLHEAYASAAKARGARLRALRRITAKAIDPKTIERRVVDLTPADQHEPGDHMNDIRIRIDHYVHNAAADPRVDDILTRLKALQAQGVSIMSKATDIQQLVTDINTATNEVASDLERLRNQIAGGLSASEADAVVAELDTLKNRLTVLGQDPENPVPEPTPPVA